MATKPTVIPPGALTYKEFRALDNDPDFLKRWADPSIPRPLIVDMPQPRLNRSGWQSTETRKKLERAAEILTRLDADECREEIQRDQGGTLRPYLESAYKQLGEMLEVVRDERLITV
jgi:hypothetical protein